MSGFKKNNNKEFNYNKARQFLLQKEKAFKNHNVELYEKACKDFEKIVSLLKEKYKIKRIYQWGSLLDKKNFSEISDIDIAVEGVESAEVFFKMYGDADNLTQFPLDLVEIEKIDPLHAESIKRYGRIVYERDK